MTPDLVEKLVLLVATAVVTGFGVPLVLKSVEERRQRAQKRFDADLARQAKIIDAQAKLLDDLAALLWKWRYLAKKVVYYADMGDAERFAAARAEYEAQVWDVLAAFRAEIGRARRLVSEAAFERLSALYSYIVHDLDPRVSAAIERDEIDRAEARALSHRFTEEVSRRLDDEIDLLAAEVGLKVPAANVRASA